MEAAQGKDDNMQEEQIKIKDVVNYYDKLTISNKRKELGREIAEMTILIQKILNNITTQDFFTEERIKDFENLYDGTISEDKYLTGLYEDILNFKELLGICLNKINTLADKDYQ